MIETSACPRYALITWIGTPASRYSEAAHSVLVRDQPPGRLALELVREAMQGLHAEPPAVPGALAHLRDQLIQFRVTPLEGGEAVVVVAQADHFALSS
ncbi:hypothetical protein [Actinomadura sp. BRA 177]|uniref:hypothetical protein n=1 Tax=Actinomadura sp. BRA 177 TaxID=2745202 RepID=UPI00159508E3|nr:hypothetical protein [Actinomadura sp. BRA 177]NVI88677.1 hypothetical protein [Actinomadura sp. BRA 177]